MVLNIFVLVIFYMIIPRLSTDENGIVFEGYVARR